MHLICPRLREEAGRAVVEHLALIGIVPRRRIGTDWDRNLRTQVLQRPRRARDTSIRITRNHTKTCGTGRRNVPLKRLFCRPVRGPDLIVQHTKCRIRCATCSRFIVPLTSWRRCPGPSRRHQSIDRHLIRSVTARIRTRLQYRRARRSIGRIVLT